MHQGDTTQTGDITHNGSVIQVGDYTQTGTFALTGAATSTVSFEAPQIVASVDITFGGISGVSHRHLLGTGQDGNTGTPTV